MGVLKQIIFAIVTAFIILEIRDRLRHLSHWLVRRAARKLPWEHRERFVEESLADLDAIEAPISKLYNAIGSFSAVSSLVDKSVAPATHTPSQRRIGVLLVVIPLLPTALFNLFTIFKGVARYFDPPSNPSSPTFAFGLIVTVVVFGYMLGSDLIWKLKSRDMSMLLMKLAWMDCVAINLILTWEETKRMTNCEADPAKAVALALVAALIVGSTAFLSRLLSDRSGPSPS